MATLQIKQSYSHAFDYVYAAEGEEFKNMHVELSVVNDKLHIVFFADEEVEHKHLDEAVRYVNNNNLKKIRADIIEECELFLNQKGKQTPLKIACDGNDSIKLIM